MVMLGAPLLGACTLALASGYRALAIASALTVLAYGVDVIAGSPLTSLSLLGPNPGLGVRFYGIGNELEALLGVLVIAGTGAALAGFAPQLSRQRCAASFLAVGLLCAFVFAAGRFGADVGAAIVLPVGAAVAAVLVAGRGSRSVLLLVVAAPFAVLALLALVDLVSGANAHLTRSVLDAGGLGDLADVAQRRLQLSARSFGRPILLAFLPVVAILGALAVVYRDRLAAWLHGRPTVRAGLWGALVATAVGTLANDSGALMLEIGTAYLLVFVGFAWAEMRGRFPDDKKLQSRATHVGNFSLAWSHGDEIHLDRFAPRRPQRSRQRAFASNRCFAARDHPGRRSHRRLGHRPDRGDARSDRDPALGPGAVSGSGPGDDLPLTLRAHRSRLAIFLVLPGGVNRHVEALAEEFLGRGHDVRVLAPFDPPGRISRVLHRADPETRTMPDYLTPLGRTVGFGANGSVSNLAPFPFGGVVAPRREVRAGEFDVIHVHEPVVPLVGWNATLGSTAPVVGTFHAYSTKAVPNHIANGLGARRVFNRLSARIAVSEAAAWTGRRWFGGDYTIIPNGVDVDAAPRRSAQPDGELRILFVGRPEERKGLPVLLTAFDALVEHVPCRLTVIGAEREDVLRYIADPELMSSIEIRGRVSGEDLWAELHQADVLCAPSLSGESFGMVLTEAFAAGTPVIASAIAGYSDVVTDGVDGVLVPPADPQRLAEELQRIHHEPERLETMGEAARQSAQRYAWPRVADQVTDVYERALAAPKPVTRTERVAHWAGVRPADGGPSCRRGACRRSTPSRPRPAAGEGGWRAGSGSGSPARSASASPSWRPRRSASTRSSRASSARTSPGCWSPAR